MTAAPSTVLITGATGGIGGALAETYAAPGVTLILQGRRQDRLRELAAICTHKGSQVITKVLDIRDTDALIAWLGDVSASTPPDLVIVNAGVNIDTGPERRGETWEDIQRLLDVNVKAALATVQGVLPSMRARNAGQIALLSSLAAYRGLPITPSYSASKAAISAYGEAMRTWLEPDGVKVNVILPGYVKSDMCDGMAGPKPFLWPPQKAARVIKAGLARNKARISFPFPLNFGCWLLGVIPSAFSGWILNRLGYSE
ncbi:SDR family oxidoreductase [Pusillimonas sp. ANT_WB101]|uniref:SDR family NAD(P)-dependent oxidoreductase n=1 Tax=Pusillimonas sp. ANT_WB101 TaxID=2597356 RepID=UPI0011EBF03A|nr:SDR family NAD(P)-dependent oxidoreductase [Pusillimonas sp. ANT_WB101]KAA0911386.1 SDR family NAD(P)-dependent oxidoreductase [Pusillimonas sp. ANT_WB101]